MVFIGQKKFSLLALAGFLSLINSIHCVKDDISDIISQCGTKDLLSCLEIRAVSLLNRVLRYDKLALTKYVSLEKIYQPPSSNNISQRMFFAGNLREYVTNNYPKSAKLVQSLLLDGLLNIFNSRALKFKLDYLVPGACVIIQRLGESGLGGIDIKIQIPDAESATETGRGMMKKLVVPLLMGLKMKAAILIPLGLMTLALLAGKALLVGKIALMLSIIIGLKNLTSSSQKNSVSYEIVPHPHRKSFDTTDSHKLAYSGHGGQHTGK